MPDLTVLGKIVGGGFPVGAYGGRADIMKKVMPAGPVFQAGTLSGNPVAMAAGIATLDELRDLDPYAELDRLGGHARRRAAQAARGAGVAGGRQPRRQHVDAVLHARTRSPTTTAPRRPTRRGSAASSGR